MLHGVVFDIEDVVIDSHLAHRTAWRTVLDTTDQEVASAELGVIFDAGKREEILRFFWVRPQQITDDGRKKYTQSLRKIGTGSNRISESNVLCRIANRFCHVRREVLCFTLESGTDA